MLQFTLDQQKALSQFELFEKSIDKFPLFILSGFAGTGKTTLVASLIHSFNQKNKKFKLLAPTGRAAKVLSSYSGELAFTIHKQIYFHNDNGGEFSITLAKNMYSDTVFFVDEASMVSTRTNDDGRCLLRDLLNYVYTGKNCKLVLIGDQGQLPPVGENIANALSESYLQENFHRLSIFNARLEQIVRQEEASSIVKNATTIRTAKNTNQKIFSFLDEQSCVIEQYEFQEELDSAYANFGIDEVKVLSISNKRVLGINEGIRSRLLYREDILEKGDRIMVNRNNYFWLKNDKDIGFIANGEILEVEKISRIEPRYGFLFGHVKISFLDFPDKEPMELLVNLDLLTSSQLQLNQLQMRALFKEIDLELGHIKSKAKRFKEISENPYWNALQVKYAYAITSHKAQGGQWKVVFIDFLGKSPEMEDNAYLKWLYTSVTRATEKIFLLNFPKNFFEG